MRLTPEELAEIRKLASADFNGHLVIRLLDEYEKLIIRRSSRMCHR